MGDNAGDPVDNLVKEGKLPSSKLENKEYAKYQEFLGLSDDHFESEVEEPIKVGEEVHFDSLQESQKIEILHQRLARRNVVLEELRKAYHRDVLVVQTDLIEKYRKGDEYVPSEQIRTIPSADLRDTIPLFSPAGTFIKVNTCGSCGGYLELIHNESEELQKAREIANEAMRNEGFLKKTIEKLRNDLDHSTEMRLVMEQKVRGLQKESAYTLEQLQLSRKSEKANKQAVQDLRTKYQMFDQYKNDVESYKKRVDQLGPEVDDLKEKNVLLDTNYSELMDEHEKLKEKHRKEAANRMLLESQVSDINEQLELKQSTIQNLVEKKNLLETETIELKESCSRQISTIAELQTEIQSLKNSHEALERQLEEEREEEEKIQDKLREKISEQKAEVSKISKELKEKTKELKKAAIKLEAGKTLNDELRNEITKKVDEGKSAIEKLVKEFNQANDMQKMYTNDLESRIHALEVNCTLFEQENVALEAMNQKLSIRVEDMRKQVQNMQPKGIGGSTTHTQIAQVDPTLERKFEKSKVEVKELKETVSKMEKKFKTLHNRERDLSRHIEDLTNTKNILMEKLKFQEEKVSSTASASDDIFKKMEKSATELSVTKRELERTSQRADSLHSTLEAVIESFCAAKNDPELTAKINNIMQQSVSLEPDLKAIEKAVNSDKELGREERRQKREREIERDRENRLSTYIDVVKLKKDFIVVELETALVSLKELTEKSEKLHDENKKSMERLEKLGQELDRQKGTTQNIENMLSSSIKGSKELKQTIAKYEVDLDALEMDNQELVLTKQKINVTILEKDLAIDRERSKNEKMSSENEGLKKELSDTTNLKEMYHKQLRELEEAEETRLATNTDVGTQMQPIMRDESMQTDRWKPNGLVLRQRNASDRIPQRYRSNASSVLISCENPDALHQANSNGSQCTIASLCASKSEIVLPKTRPVTVGSGSDGGRAEKLFNNTSRVGKTTLRISERLPDVSFKRSSNLKRAQSTREISTNQMWME